jgi:capsular exopolysaccharide synthesis family protein
MSSRYEAYENLKNSLLAHHRKNQARSLMLVGISSGDGVSSTAIGLAEALALDAPNGVVLIDANFRDRHQHNLITPGGELPDLAGILQEGKEPIPGRMVDSNLNIIPCGEKPQGVQSLLDSTRFSQLLADMCKRFTFVVVDTAPVLNAPESLFIASKVDAVIMVVRSGVTRREKAEKTKQLLDEAGAKIIGVVLNKRRYYIPDKLYGLLFGK